MKSSDDEQENKGEVFDNDFIADYLIHYTGDVTVYVKKTSKQHRLKPINDKRMALYDWLQSIVFAIITGIMLFVFIGRIDGITGPSMMQTLQNGDTIVLSNLFFTPKYKDIVFIKTEAFGDTPIVKRVIATAGQTVDIDFNKGVVSVNGKELQENYVNTLTNRRENFEGPVTVPEGHVFVMGDNRNASTDSRDNTVGMVDIDTILGKVYFVLIPGPGYESKRDWSRIGSVYR